MKIRMGTRTYRIRAFSSLILEEESLFRTDVILRKLQYIGRLMKDKGIRTRLARTGWILPFCRPFRSG